MRKRDERLEPAYRGNEIDITFADNEYILKWWSEKHDEIIKKLIQKLRWLWWCEIYDEVVKVTSEDILEKWRSTDPICKEFVWYNVIMYFAKARADKIGLTVNIKTPKKKCCLICKNYFMENSLRYPLVIRLGIDNLVFCGHCLENTIYPNSGSDYYDEKAILEYLRGLTKILQRVPAQGFGEGVCDLDDFTKDEKIELTQFMRRKPSVKRIKKIYGSWFKALIAAGILSDGTRKNSRGIQCIAKDGDVCYSLGEKTIDDLLFSMNLEHTKECHYPNSNYRSDFFVQGIHIEYLGLGTRNTIKRQKIRLSFAKKII